MKMDVKSIITKYYEDLGGRGQRKNKANSNLIKANLKIPPIPKEWEEKGSREKRRIARSTYSLTG